MSRIVHFEIPANNPEKLVEFFGTVFGWKFQKWDGPIPYWLVTTGDREKPGIDGGLAPRRGPEETICNVIGVDDLDPYIEKVQKHGATIVSPKHAIPGVGWVAYFKDPDGNVHGMFQGDPAAR